MNPKDYSVKIFVAYSRKDKELLEMLRKNLVILQRARLVEQIWYDGLIEAGDKWEDTISKSIEDSDIILLLISSDFISSDYCYNVEMKKALQLHEEGRTKVVPIILRECMWEYSDFAQLQALPKNGKAIQGDFWKNDDIAFTEVVKSLMDLINTLKKEQQLKERIIKQEQYEKIFKQANQLYIQNNWQGAYDLFKTAFELYDNDFEPKVNIIEQKMLECNKEIRFNNEKQKGFNSYDRKEYLSAITHFKNALQFKNDEKLNDIIGLCENEIKTFNFPDYIEKAKQYYKNGNYHEALNLIENAFKINNSEEWELYSQIISNTSDISNPISIVVVREVFQIPKIGPVYGCYVKKGKIQYRHRLLIKRNHVPLYVDDILEIRRFKDTVKEVDFGYEFGLRLKLFKEIKIGDVIESYHNISRR